MMCGHGRRDTGYADSQPAPVSSSSTLTSTASDSRTQLEDDIPSSPLSDFEHVSRPSSSTHSAMSAKARLLYCKSHVSIHPTQFNKDNISGYLALVEADSIGTNAVQLDLEGNVGNSPAGKTGKEIIVTWVPDEVLQRMDQEDRDGYRKVEERGNATRDAEDDGEWSCPGHG